MKESVIVEQLKKSLEGKFEQIWIHKKVSASREFRDNVKRSLGYSPILQPEFDLVFKTFSGELNAIEVKYLKKCASGQNLPYYRGIGQALALARFGFDHVGLWLVVEETVDLEVLSNYGNQAWEFVRNQMNLPIEYSYLQIRNTGVDFELMVYDREGRELLKIDDPKFSITWKVPNPLRFNEEQKILRALVEKYLEDHV